ncbi:GNAT family N-acetyltransferase [Sneathiella aquimaris]|uniref:GNAT family N-acetyltransferase n=1 Tax=Sneathiella aquimaris TaxID=2599305 RepID=UPI00146BFC7C|nr:GNAT family N-acetyltransferase [Sneathiella aquimaris]
MTDIVIQKVDPEHIKNLPDALGNLLKRCVDNGASVGFIQPFEYQEARHYWMSTVVPAVERSQILLWVAMLKEQVVGTVMLQVSMLPNQTHRAEVGKLLVDPDCRRMGIGRRLMHQVEEGALQAGKLLLTLDTRTGDVAEPLYHQLGFRTAGVIPDYCKRPEIGSQILDATTYMYKRID